MIKVTAFQRLKTSLKQFLRRLWPRMDSTLEGARQKVPFNVNRFVLLFISIIYTSTSACVYFNWNSMREVIYAAGKYKELNTNPSVDKVNSEQYQTINNLFPTTLAIHFTMSVVCGFLYDHIGPKFTAALGQIFNILCWVFLSLDTTKFNATLIGFVFMGLGADTAFIPVLTIANLFPDASTFILTLIGAAASLSFAVPVALKGIMHTFPNLSFTWICYLYICSILLPCLLVALLLFPYKPFKGVDDYEREKKRTHVDNLEDAPRYNENMSSYRQDINGRSNNEETAPTNENVSIVNHTNSAVELEKVEVEDVLHMPCRRGSNQLLSLKPKNELGGVIDEEQVHEHDKNHVPRDRGASIEWVNVDEKELDEHFHWASIKLFFKLLISFPSLCVIFYFIIFNISIVFYLMVNESYFDYDPFVIDVIDVLSPLSCIPCIMFGRIVNRCGAAIVIIMMNASSVLMHLTALIKYRVYGIFSAMFYMFATSMYTSQIYCFIQNAFPTIVFGKFIGFASLCGGLCSLFTKPLYQFIINQAAGEKLDPSIVTNNLIGIFIILFLPLTILKMRNYERVSEFVANDSFGKSYSVKSRKDDVFSKI